ncbi:MAG: hypothetical protein J6A01_04665 [Proteobacteria bacterium]|nr:hypothetical protein [Pseudomonadota bacterium]
MSKVIKYAAALIASCAISPAAAQESDVLPVQTVSQQENAEVYPIMGEQTSLPENADNSSEDTANSMSTDISAEEDAEPEESNIPDANDKVQSDSTSSSKAFQSQQTFIPPLIQSSGTKCDETMAYPNATMRRAETAYTKRRYTTVIETLRPVYENLRCVEDTDTIIEIYLLLGVSHLELGQSAQADNFFLNVLRTDPDYDPLGAIIMLPRASTERIEVLREQHAAELEILRPERTKDSVVETLFVPGETERRLYWLNFIPMGTGMFQMHQTEWGIVYASTQLAGIVMSILGGGMVEYYRGENFTFTHKDYNRAKKWQAVQITGIATLAVGYVVSVLHAIIIYEEAPINWRSPTKTPPSYTQVTAPFLLPDGVGVTYGMTF